MKVLGTTGLTELVTKIKAWCRANFLDQADTETVTEVTIDASPTSGSQNLVSSGGTYTAIAAKSTVSVSASGTATDEVAYITVDGVEKKLAGGGDDTNAVHYTADVGKSAAEKAQARTNIGANSVSVSQNGTATDRVDYVTVDGTEKLIGGQPDYWRLYNGCVCVAYDTTDYLCFTANTDGSGFGMTQQNVAPRQDNLNIEYSFDKITWTPLIRDSTAVSLAHAGDKAYLRGTNTFVGGNSFTMWGSISASGNIMTLLDPTGESTSLTTRYSFAWLFKDCYSLAVQPDLPATTLSNQCYEYMFSECIGLTRIPNIQATYIPYRACNMMFYGCTGLTTANLSSVSIGDGGYRCMFEYCTSLTSIVIMGTSLAENAYESMMSHCSALQSIKIVYTGNINYRYMSNWTFDVASSGTFYYNGSSTERGSSAIPDNWTIQTF